MALFTAKAQRGWILENELSKIVIGTAIEVHRTLGGPGLLESIYESALCHELTLHGLKYEKQLAVPVKYKNTIIKEPLFIDILVENKLVIEVKATDQDNPVYQAQLLTYLRLCNLNLGLLINFGKKQVRNGILRVVNNLHEDL